VLQEIGAERVPQIEVYNKVDALDLQPRREPAHDGQPERVWVSARTGAGLDLLAEAIASQLEEEMVHGWIDLPASAGRLRARLFDRGAVVHEQVAADGDSCLEIRLPRRSFEELAAHEGLSPDVLRH
jgi:GTP-binding protein HflX